MSISRKNHKLYRPYQAPRPTVSVDWSPVVLVMLLAIIVITLLAVGGAL